jgi:hypothetical protein
LYKAKGVAYTEHSEKGQDALDLLPPISIINNLEDDSWFPRKISDLDRTQNVLMYGSELGRIVILHNISGNFVNFTQKMPTIQDSRILFIEKEEKNSFQLQIHTDSKLL